jgi:hypothetical protein
MELPGTAFSQNGKEDLIVVENLVKYFPIRGGILQRVQAWVKAVDGVSFTVERRRTGRKRLRQNDRRAHLLGLITRWRFCSLRTGRAGRVASKKSGAERVWTAALTALLFLPAPNGKTSSDPGAAIDDVALWP